MPCTCDLLTVLAAQIAEVEAGADHTLPSRRITGARNAAGV